MAGLRSTELMGAGGQNLRVSGTEAKASVALDSAVHRKVAHSLAAVAAAAQPKPDRVFLNLENVRGLNDATTFKVYINVPDGEDPANYPAHLAGSVALFGVRKATLANQQQAGWALMVLPLVAGGGHLPAMAAVALFVFAERLDHPAPLAWGWRGPGKALRIVAAQARMRLAF